jgi:hypothetical protein
MALAGLEVPYIGRGSLDAAGDFLLRQVELAASIADHLPKGALRYLFRHRTTPARRSVPRTLEALLLADKFRQPPDSGGENVLAYPSSVEAINYYSLFNAVVAITFADRLSAGGEGASFGGAWTLVLAILELTAYGELKDFYSIRVNDQWRIIFKWHAGDAHEVRIADYHQEISNEG